MENRCFLGLFAFSILFAFHPAFAAQVETITESGKPLIRKSSGGRPLTVHSTALSDRQLSATSRLARQYPWKTSIVTTVFWIGEQPTGNNPVANRTSSRDKQWPRTYGGFADHNPANRANNIP